MAPEYLLLAQRNLAAIIQQPACKDVGYLTSVTMSWRSHEQKCQPRQVANPAGVNTVFVVAEFINTAAQCGVLNSRD